MRGQLSGILVGTTMLCLVGLASPAGAAGVSVKVTPAKGLANHQSVKVVGKGLPVTTNGKANSFFVDECNAAVTGKLSPADASHCDVALAKALKVSASGAFSISFKVATGTVGDGVCGKSGHLTCVIGVGDGAGQGTVAKITFK